MAEQGDRDPRFDGHREFDLKFLSTKDKLLYISLQIELRHYIRTRVRRVDDPRPDSNAPAKPDPTT
ncbi:MAG: hypothetical protein RB296_11025 [Acidobacteriota bacterium]|jgi:hypothetical protein|nr:hypothetical protein [Acidobacteriota bacterium]